MSSNKTVLVFESAGSKFAINIENMTEIIEMVEIQPIPDPSPVLKGVINYRGKVVPVFDLCHLLNGKVQDITINTPMILININNKLSGFVVDKVIGVHRLERQAVMPVLEVGQEYVSNAFEYQENVLLIIDLSKIIQAVETDTDSKIINMPESLAVSESKRDNSLMHDRALSLSKTLSKVKKEHHPYVCFKSNEETYGIDIDYVNTVLKIQKIHWVPGLPNFVLGIFNKRGEVVSVVDFKAFIGLKRSDITKKSGLIVLKNENMETAVLVDSVIGVVEVERDNIQPPPAILNKDQAEYLQGEIQLKDSLIVLISADKMLNAKKLTRF